MRQKQCIVPFNLQNFFSLVKNDFTIILRIFLRILEHYVTGTGNNFSDQYVWSKPLGWKGK